MPKTNQRVLLSSRPVGEPKVTDFTLDEAPVEEPGEQQVLVRQQLMSLDPAMRGWMTNRKSYTPPVGLGEVMRSLGVSEVVASKADGWSPGDVVAGRFGWQQFCVAEPRHLYRLPPGLDPELALGPLGMTGMTAYFGLFDVGAASPGDTVLVSSAAGAVGSMVGQLARIEGCRAVGIAGGAEKCRWLLDEVGFDAAIDYKAGLDLDAEIASACPDRVDVFFDNVGGMTLDTGLRHLNRGARVVICGAISVYNATEPPPGPMNYIHLLIQRARMEGFIVMDYEERYGEAQEAIGTWLAAGKIRYRSHVVVGLENAPQALGMLFDGSNHGKLLVEVV